MTWFSSLFIPIISLWTDLECRAPSPAGGVACKFRQCWSPNGDLIIQFRLPCEERVLVAGAIARGKRSATSTIETSFGTSWLKADIEVSEINRRASVHHV